MNGYPVVTSMPVVAAKTALDVYVDRGPRSSRCTSPVARLGGRARPHRPTRCHGHSDAGAANLRGRPVDTIGTGNDLSSRAAAGVKPLQRTDPHPVLHCQRPNSLSGEGDSATVDRSITSIRR